MSEKPHRDVEKVYSVKDFATKLRRLADALEGGKPFTIQVLNERFTVPADASISIEHERDEEGEELEFQLTWRRAAGAAAEEEEEVEEEEDTEEGEDAEDAPQGSAHDDEADQRLANGDEAQQPTTPQD